MVGVMAAGAQPAVDDAIPTKRCAKEDMILSACVAAMARAFVLLGPVIVGLKLFLKTTVFSFSGLETDGSPKKHVRQCFPASCAALGFRITDGLF